MTRRNTELLLLLAAAPVVLLTFALVRGALSPAGAVGWRDLLVPAGLLAAFGLAHVAVRRFAPRADPAILPVVTVLSGIGLAFVGRLDPRLAASQTVWMLVGIAVLVLTLALVPSLERVGRYKYTIALVATLLLVAPALVGTEVNGARLWLRVAGVSFQPAEVAKILLVLFLAAYLAENREILSVSTRRVAGVWLPSARHLAPLLVMWAVSLFILIAEKDLGSSLLFFGMFLAMMHVATGRSAYAVVGLVLFALGATAAYFAFTHVRTRVGIWLDPFSDAAGKGYQLVQSLFSLGAGGVLGVGPGRGMPGRIPYVATDFIFAAVGEELGLLGAAGLLIAYLVVCVRGLATAVRARSDMAALTATGLVAALALQVFVIVGGVTRLIPLTGITLPFVSYGGSSIVANFMLVGLLLRAGDEGTGEDTALVSSGETGVLGRYALAGRVRAVAITASALVALLVADLAYLQVFAAPALAARPENTRRLAAELRSPRGAIVTVDGVTLARSVRLADGTYGRVYPHGMLAAHVVGYASRRYGRAGIEAASNETLSGHRAYATWDDVLDDALGRPVPGNDVVLTIDSRIQAAAERALAGRRGAVVVLDPRDGRVLALASAPAYAPAYVDADWDALHHAEGSPLLDRAIAATYPPGSTFKIVTVTAALASGVATTGTTFRGPARLEIGGGTVTNYESGAFGRVTVRRALASSINTVFAQLADAVGAQRLVAQSRAFGFDEPVPFDLPVVPSIMPAPERMTRWETAWAGVGQPVGAGAIKGPVATPLQMALVAAGIADGGDVMMPRLVAKATDPGGRALTTTSPSRWTAATDRATAAQVAALMEEVVRSGSGTRARIAGARVAGKTGTAEVGEGLPTHAWFIAFAPASRPRLAMAIVLEQAGVGGRVAAPAARPVIEEALLRTR